jgi:tetratricopeptide (TPR) repeat protein/Mrp family chromosome partitioning ATPase
MRAGLSTGASSADKSPSFAKVQLKVVHGHLAFSKHPVLVGHYNGDTFAGAEAQLDRALERRLSQRRSLGLYPGPLGSNTIVLDDSQRPCGAVVVGLGEAASLSLGGLRRTLRQGILALAAAEIDRHRTPSDMGEKANRPDVPISFSALVVGSGDGGLDRTTCITAMLQAAAEAQSVFAETKDLKAQLASIEILELLEYRAFAIWHIVNEVLARQSNLGDLFACDPEVGKRKGGRRRVYALRDHSWWEPIQISMAKSADGQRSLAFAVAGGLARAELRTIAADLDVVEPLMRRAIKSNDPDGANATPGRALFELLWPSSLKDQSTEESNRRLILDEESAQFPWELLDDRRPWAEDSQLHNGKQDPPVVRYGLVRQLLQTRFQQRVVVPTGRPKALIIGNPRGAQIPERFPELLGAEAEAGAIRELLSSTHDVTILTGREATPENVCEQLFAQAWEIVHISAHGVVRAMMAGPDGQQKPMTGVVLGGGVVLGPSVLSKMPVSPGVFFLNCCHLGHIDPTAEEQAQQAALTAVQPELAASLAVQLIKNGVRAVVAAGWAVKDTVAQAFGTKFYDAMLDGSGFGEATLAARGVAYKMDQNGTTWGAYQCYGEPDYTFPAKCRRPRSSHVTGGGGARSFVACVEAIAEVERLGDEVNIGLERDLKSQHTRLAEIEATAQKWLDSAELRVALAEAYGDLCDLPKAIEHYEAARTGTDSQFKVKAIEQLANLTARQAAISFRKGPAEAGDLPATVGKIEEARTLIQNLIKVLGPTTERLSIEGSCWKRLAQVDPVRTDETLKQMAEAYQRAADCGAKEKSGSVRPLLATYPPLMVSAARLVSGLRAGRCPDDVKEGIVATTQKFAAEDSEDFWQLIEATDVRMMVAMAAGSINEDDEGEMLRAYAKAWKHVGSPRMLMSVVEQLDFYEDALKTGTPASESTRAAIVGSVRRIRDGLWQAAGI